MPKNAVILAGGRGKRLFPYTEIFPKPLLPIRGKQILAYIIDDLISSGIDSFNIAISEDDDELFRNYLGESLNILYATSPRDYNTCGRLLEVIDQTYIDEPFLLHYGDIITDIDYELLWKFHDMEDAIATLVVKRGWRIPKGLVKSENGFVTEFIERYPLNEDIWTGVAMLHPEVLKYIDSPYDDIATDLFPTLLDNDEKVKIFQFGGFFLDIGTQKDFNMAEEYLKDQHYF